MRVKVIRLTALASVTILAACGANGPSCGAGGAPAIPAWPQVLYPPPPTVEAIPNYGGFNVILSRGAPSATLTLSTPGSQTAIETGSAIVPAPSPYPVGAASPGPFDEPTAYAVPANSLTPGATYTVVVAVTAGQGCPTQAVDLGTFATQPIP